MDRIPDVDAMRRTLARWIAEQRTVQPGIGCWALTLSDGVLVGGLTLRKLPVAEDDVELSWQLALEHWGRGYATEAGRRLAQYAFDQDIDELFAVVSPENTRGAASARRLGMQWVGETEKYYGLRLDVYRLRRADLIEAEQHGGPAQVNICKAAMTSSTPET